MIKRDEFAHQEARKILSRKRWLILLSYKFY